MTVSTNNKNQSNYSYSLVRVAKLLGLKPIANFFYKPDATSNAKRCEAVFSSLLSR